MAESAPVCRFEAMDLSTMLLISVALMLSIAGAARMSILRIKGSLSENSHL